MPPVTLPPRRDRTFSETSPVIPCSHCSPFHSPRYLREYVHPAVDGGLRASGRPRQDFTYATASFVITGETERERARNAEAVRQQIAFYASTRTYEPVLATHGWEGVVPELHQRSLAGDWKGMASLITESFHHTSAVHPFGSHMVLRSCSPTYEGNMLP